MPIRQKNALYLWLLLLPSLSNAEESAETVLDVQSSYQQQARNSQGTVAQLDEETLAMLSAYNTEASRLEALTTYNENLRAMLASQAEERERLVASLRELEVTRRQMVPLMSEMVEILEQFLALDVPMLQSERSARLAALKQNMVRSDVEMAEKFRRIMESYQIEAEYGQSIEAYEGQVTINEKVRTVDFLRVGRAALFYISLNRDRAAIWDPLSSNWSELDSSHYRDLDFALRVARKQAPPDLMRLPLWSPR